MRKGGKIPGAADWRTMSGWRLDQADKAAWARKARDAGMRPGHIVLALGISREELDVLLGEKLL